MASKVNTKFLTFLVLAICAAAMLIGGLYVLNVRGNAKRNIRLGEEALAASDLRKARDYFGRAVHKEPGNMQYLARLEEVTVQIRPRTGDEARELYTSWLGSLHHAARHDSTNADRHVRLLTELTSTTRRMKQGWDAIVEPAEDMWDHVPDTDPRRYLGKVYKSMAFFYRSKVSTLEEIAAAEQEMTDIVQHLPENDLAWATLIHGHVAMAEKLRDQGRTGDAIDQQIARIRDAVQRALQAVPNGPEVARIRLYSLAMELSLKPDSVSEIEIDEAANHLQQALHGQDVDPGLMTEAVDLLAVASADGPARSCDILEEHLEKNPEAVDKRLLLANLAYMSNQLDRAEQAAMYVIDAEQLPVGFLSQLQSELRRQAGGILVDVEGKRWANAAPEDRAAQITRMEQARDRLASLVSDSANDSQVLRADAKIAYTKADYSRAAMLYERLVKETAYVDNVETLFFAAVSLEKVNQIGRAHERVAQALQINPGNPMLLKFKARIELNMGRRAEAANTMKLLPRSEMNAEDVVQLLAAINSDPNAPPGAESTDPVTTAVTSANAAMTRGDLDAARGLLTAALANASDDMRLLYAMAALEIRAGNQSVAKEFVQRGLAIDPKSVGFLQWDAMLKHENPVDALREFHMATISDERERAISMVTGMKVLAWRHETMALRSQQEGNAEAAEKSTAIAKQAYAEASEWAARAEQLAPDEPRLLEYFLDEAASDQDWARAEQILARARAANADQANGLFFKGRLELARADSLVKAGKAVEGRQFYQEAVRSLETVTDRVGYHANAWKALAFAYSSLGNFTQAERAYEQAYKCNPNDLDGVRAYLDVLIRRGDETRALRILRDAHRLAPNDDNVRHLWLKMESQSGDRALALRTRRQLAKQNPDDKVNAAELVHLLSSIQPDRSTILDSNGNPVFPEAGWTRMSAEERMAVVAQARSAWYKEADAILARLKEKMQGDVRFASLHAHTLRARGDVEAGEQVLREFIASQNSPTLESLLELGRYQMRASHYGEAVTTFTEALKLQDEKTRTADQELAQLYMMLTMYEKAVEHLNQILSVSSDRTYRNQLVECLLKLKRFDEAETQLQEIVKADGEDFMAMLLAASIADARGDELVAKGETANAERRYASQREMLNRAQTLEPLSIMPRMLLAQSLVKEYRRTQRETALNDALHVLEDAETARPATLEIGMLRVSVFKAKNDLAAATSELQRIVERFPDNHMARRDLTEVLLHQGLADQAIAVIDNGIRANPTLSVWHEASGDLHMQARGNAQAALAAYTKAYEIAPTGSMLLKMTEATLGQATPNCRSLLARYAARAPADFDASPLLREGYARALNCAERHNEAVEHLRLAYATRKKMMSDGKMQSAEMAFWFQAVTHVFVSTTPGIIDSSAAEQFVLEQCGNSPSLIELRGLARLWLNSGDRTLARSIDYQLQALKKADPADKQSQIEVHDELAKFYFASGLHKEAAGAYETLLKFDPDRIEALNNFAYITAVSLEDPKKAIPFAERAVQLAPQRATIIDTLGWVHYLAGDLSKAREYLQESLRIQPTAPTHVHLAAVMIDSGDLNGASFMLDEASRLNPDGETKKDIERVAENLRKAREKNR